MHLCASCRESYSTTMSAASCTLIGLPESLAESSFPFHTYIHTTTQSAASLSHLPPARGTDDDNAAGNSEMPTTLHTDVASSDSNVNTTSFDTSPDPSVYPCRIGRQAGKEGALTLLSPLYS